MELIFTIQSLQLFLFLRRHLTQWCLQDLPDTNGVVPDQTTSNCRHLSICSHVVISVPMCDIPPHSQSFIFVNEVCTCIGGTFSCMQYLSDYYCWHDI